MLQKKRLKNGVSQQTFDPSYFDRALKSQQQKTAHCLPFLGVYGEPNDL